MEVLDWQDDMETDERQRELEWEWGKATWGRLKCTRVLALRRIHKDITKAVKEKRWKDADELETEFEWTKTVQARHAAEGPSMAEQEHFARIKRAKHPGGRPPPHTSDEYVEDPEEKMIRVIQHVANRYMPSTGASSSETTRPPKRPLSPPSGDGSSNKKGNFGPRHGHAEGEPDPTRHGQLPPGIRPEPCPDTGRCRVCLKCYIEFEENDYDANAIDCMFWRDDAID